MYESQERKELSAERTGATQPPTTGHGWSCGRGQGNDAERLGVKLMEAARSVMLMQKYYFFLYIQSLYIRFFVDMQSVALPLWSLNPARRRHGDDWKQKKGVVFQNERSDSRNATDTQLSLGCALVHSPWHSPSKLVSAHLA